MNLNKHSAETDMEMDMTPMIDVVFLLIIFFMVITDLSQQDLEELEMAVAKNAVPDKPDPKAPPRPILNVKHTGVMILKRNTYFDPEVDKGPKKYQRLRDQLYLIAQQMKKAPIEPGASRMVPDDPLMIRVDASTDFKYVQDIMKECGDTSISIWKLQIGVKVPQENAAKK